MTQPINNINELGTTLSVQREEWDQRNIPPPHTQVNMGFLLQMLAKGPTSMEGVKVTGSVKGDGFILIPLWTGTGSNLSGSFQGAVRNHLAQDFEQFRVPMRQAWSMFAIDWVAMEFAADGGWVITIPQMLTGTRLSFWRSLSWKIHEDGSGAVARSQVTPDAATGIATDTLTLLNRDLIHRLNNGDRVSLAAGPRVGGTLLTRRVGVTPGEGGILDITGIDEERGRITFSAVINTVVPTAADGDYLTLDGDYDGTSLSSSGASGPIAGLDLWCPTRISNVGTLYGVDRATNPSRLAGRRVHVSSKGIHEAVGNLAVALSYVPHTPNADGLTGTLLYPARMEKELMDAFASRNIVVTNARPGATTGSDPSKMQFGISGAVVVFGTGHNLVLKSDVMMGDMELEREVDATMRVVLNDNLEMATTRSGVNWQMRDGERVLIPVDGATTEHNAPYGCIGNLITHNPAKNLVVSTETKN